MIITEPMLKPFSVKPQSTISFTLDKHDVVSNDEIKTHWDIKLNDNSGAVVEWSMVNDPVLAQEPIVTIAKSVAKTQWNLSGNIIIGSLNTTVSRIDSGKVDVIDATNEITSWAFHGEKMKGLWILKKGTTKYAWILSKSELKIKA
jgi:hypothetical protein